MRMLIETPDHITETLLKNFERHSSYDDNNNMLYVMSNNNADPALSYPLFAYCLRMMPNNIKKVKHQSLKLKDIFKNKEILNIFKKRGVSVTSERAAYKWLCIAVLSYINGAFNVFNYLFPWLNLVNVYNMEIVHDINECLSNMTSSDQHKYRQTLLHAFSMAAVSQTL